jgi:hypothetical protein
MLGDLIFKLKSMWCSLLGDIIFKLKPMWCSLWGHHFLSNHVGVIRCERCKLPWEVSDGR